MRARIVLIFLMVSSLWALLLFRLAYVQILPNPKLSQLHKRQFNTTLRLNPRRGAILDRNGKELAVSVNAYSLYADPQLIDRPRKVATRLSKILGRDPKSILRKISDSEKRFAWIDRRLSAETRSEILAMNEPGLQFLEEPKRIYPNDFVLGPVLGFVGNEGQGLEGIELKYEESLRGEGRTVRIQKDAHGRPLIIGSNFLSDPPEGDDLVLTIDSELQYFLEQELLSSVKRHLADDAIGIVLDAKTSEVLAMASVPTVNPNLGSNGDPALRRNRALTDPIEPGSTMKTFTVAGAIREGVAAPNTKFDCEQGAFKVDDRIVREADSKHRFGWLTLSDILAVSSNVGSSKVALGLGDQRLSQVLRDFGFGEKTGIDLPGESRGILPPTPWKNHLLATVSFGHSAAVTPLQLANAYAAIANGGSLRRPWIVKERRSKSSGNVMANGSIEIRRVLSEKDAQTMKFTLMSVVSHGTGQNARVAGFQVAGKTGTAQKADLKAGGYKDKAYVSSFVGMVPANDPKYVILIMIDDPKLGYYGSDVAAPVFSKVAGYAVRRAGLTPSLIASHDVLGKFPIAKTQALPDSKSGRVPSVLGKTVREALRILRKEGLQATVTGAGDGRVVSSSPASGEPSPPDKLISLSLEGAEASVPVMESTKE